MKKFKEGIKSFKKLWGNERARSAMFLAFYFVFFLVLIMMIRSGNSNKTNTTVDEDNKSNITANYDLSKIIDANYKFTITEDIGLNQKIYEGERNGDRSSFLMTENESIRTFFTYGDIVLEKVNSKYQVAVNPFLYRLLNDYNTVVKLLDIALLKAKTSYEDGSTIYSYEISTTSIEEIFKRNIIDIDDPVNKIEVEVDGYKDVIGIKYYLTNYYKYDLQLDNEVVISYKYKDFKTVEELEIPE